MANDLAGTVWSLDTTGSTNGWTGRVKIAEISFDGYAGAGDICILKESSGKVIFKAVGQAGLLPIRSQYGEGKWVDGLYADTLQNGGIARVSIL